jgi:putative Holliday junction resolvase
MIYESIKDFALHLKKGRAIIGLDIGTSRIGIAISDTEYIIASPHEIYERRNTRQDLGHINKLAEDENAIAFVIGLPLALNGAEGDNCELVRVFANQLFKKTNLPILLKDERMSTAASSRVLSESGMTRKKRQSLDDKLAAGFILQGVLDTLKHCDL